MARELRVSIEGAVYHLIAKGNQGDFIFKENGNKKYFLKCIGEGAKKFEANVYAYCIMGNHYHVMLRINQPNLSELMHYVGSSFATHLRNQGRIGHIFSGRYKSILLDRGERVFYLSKYIHLNPVRAGMVRRPEEYDWSSYRFFAWDVEPPEWLFTGWFKERYERCAPSISNVRENYREFMKDDIHLPSDDAEHRETIRVIMGIERYLWDLLGGNENQAGLEDLRLSGLHEEICRQYGLSDLRLCGKGEQRKTLREARSLFVFVAREYSLGNDYQVAEKLGDVSCSAVAKQYDNLKRSFANDETGRLQKLKECKEVVARFWTPTSWI